jgi:pimeloyl-ACP methyl ester carboxylesterase
VVVTKSVVVVDAVMIGGSVPLARPSPPHAEAAMGNVVANTDRTPNRTPFTTEDVRRVLRLLPRRRTLRRMSMGDFPGAVAPVRQYKIDVGGLGIAVHEWGDRAGQPVFLVHGGFDFGRTYEVFAPKLAAAGWRVVAWDQRGHGDSDHAALYGWDADVRDAMAVLDAITTEPAPVVGHSKGGALMIQLADAQPYRFSHLVNLDGLPSKRRVPDVAEHERTRMVAGEISGWLDHRRRTADLARKPGTIEELARRRGRMNPRASFEWLCHLVTVGARLDADGWRWKIDASMRFGGFGPWRPEWTMTSLPGLGMPFLGVLGSELEDMGPGTLLHHVAPFIPQQGRVEMLEGVGHFVHIEQPDLVAAMVLDFLEST